MTRSGIEPSTSRLQGERSTISCHCCDGNINCSHDPCCDFQYLELRFNSKVAKLTGTFIMIVQQVGYRGALILYP